MKPLVLIYARMPRYGCVKTRLARDIGKMGALQFYQTQLALLVRRLSADPRWETRLAFASAVDVSAGTCPNLAPYPFDIQKRGDLGQRMAASLRQSRPTIVVGSDIPEVSARHIHTAIKALDSHDAVFGPAPDGGYWLIGLKNLRAQPPGFLKNVRWSSPHTLSDTVATLPKCWRFSCISMLEDVDNGVSFDAWRMRLKRKKPE